MRACEVGGLRLRTFAIRPTVATLRSRGPSQSTRTEVLSTKVRRHRHFHLLALLKQQIRRAILVREPSSSVPCVCNHVDRKSGLLIWCNIPEISIEHQRSLYGNIVANHDTSFTPGWSRKSRPGRQFGLHRVDLIAEGRHARVRTWIFSARVGECHRARQQGEPANRCAGNLHTGGQSPRSSDIHRSLGSGFAVLRKLRSYLKNRSQTHEVLENQPDRAFLKQLLSG